MANRNLHVLVNFVDTNTGKHLPHFGSCNSFVMNVAMIGGGASEERPDPVAIKAVLISNGKIPAGTTPQIVAVANLGAEHNPAGLLV